MKLDRFQNFTPGPWRRRLNSNVVLSEHGLWLGRVFFQPTTSTRFVSDIAQCEANIELMAAAPSLLEYARKQDQALGIARAYFEDRIDVGNNGGPNLECSTLNDINATLGAYPWPK